MHNHIKKIMNKLSYRIIGVLMLLSLVNLSGCTDDDNDTPIIKKYIVGVWTSDATELIPSPSAEGNIVVVNKDGTGTRYYNASAYENKSQSGVISTFTWSVADDASLVYFVETENPSHGDQVWEYGLIPALYSEEGILWKVNYALEYSWEWTKYK